MARGRELVGQLGFDAPLRDVRAAADWLLAPGLPCGRRGRLLLGWRRGLPGGDAPRPAGGELLRPAGPAVPARAFAGAASVHFGERDALIPSEVVDRIAARLPKVPLFRYPAGHAFNRLGDPHGDPACAALARERTLAFLGRAWARSHDNLDLIRVWPPTAICLR